MAFEAGGGAQAGLSLSGAYCAGTSGRSAIRKTILTALVPFVLLVLADSSAAAQESDGQLALPEGATLEVNEGSLYSGPYEVTGDGDLIYGGDVSFRCEELPAFAAQQSEAARADGVAVEPTLDEAIRLCVKAGFLPERGPATSAPRDSGDDALPETGGFTSGRMPLLGAVAVSAAGALLLLRFGR